MSENEWLAYGSFGWTVYRPWSSQGITDTVAIAADLSRAGEAEITEMLVAEEPNLAPAPIVYFEELGPGYFLFESEESYVSENAILELLSRNGQLWNMSWNAGFHSRMTYAESGILALKWLNVQNRDFPRRETRLDIDGYIHSALALCNEEDRNFGLADMMATIEMASGAHLSSDWVQNPQKCFVVGDPRTCIGWPFEAGGS
ncbi:hypothetical protein ACFWYW_31060 [Nonomuraea sp. NPDC059023]|uniref:hypothetical protein n=1 Tax=unclassified Nonomuraea TaxID=2593643 RepID=UPI003682DCD9